MRCAACDAIMTTNEMVIREETGEFEDLCLMCRKASADDSETEDNTAVEVYSMEYYEE